MIERPDPQDAADTSLAVRAFLSALGGDDDAELLSVISGALLEQVGTEPGMCKRVRAAMGVSGADSHLLGVSSKVRAIPDGPMVFMIVLLDASETSGRMIGFFGPEQVAGWAMTAAFERGRWRVTGMWHGERWPAGTRYLDLPWAPSATRE